MGGIILNGCAIFRRIPLIGLFAFSVLLADAATRSIKRLTPRYPRCVFFYFQEGKRMSNDLMDVMMGSENELIGRKEQERNVVTVRVRDRDTFFSMISDVSKVCATSDAIPVLQMIKMSIKKSVPRRKKDGNGMEEAQGNP
jgi:hypothetical protein